MLQVMTGKFFDTLDHHETPRKAILYSNFYYDRPIETVIGTLERVKGTETAYSDQSDANVNTYLFTYINRMPKTEQPIQLVAVGDNEIVEEFSYLCSHGLQAIFSKDQELIKRHCLLEADQSNTTLYPVSTFFNKQIWGTDETINNFINYVKHFIGQPNVSYKQVMECYKSMFNSLLNLSVNLDLAFSQLVYCLESLPQNNDNFIPEWSDYPEDIRIKLEKKFAEIENDSLVESIKKTLIEATHLKSQNRFIEFTIAHVEPDFFRSEAANVKNPIKKMQLKQSLFNAYARRSKYVHMLKSFKAESHLLNKQREVFQFQNSPYLTYSGLMRLTGHVIKNFVLRTECIEKELIDWNIDLPGTREFYPSLKEFYYSVDGLNKDTILNNMVIFLDTLEVFLNFGKLTDINFTPLLELYEKKIHEFKALDKQNMLVVYILSHKIFKTIDKKNYAKIIKDHNQLWDKCSIQGLIVGIFDSEMFRWTASEEEKTYRTYKKKRLKHVDKSPYSIMNIPFSIEIGIFINIANHYLTEKNVPKFKELLEEAIDELSGASDKQDILTSHLKNNTEVDINFLYYNGHDHVDSIE